MRRKKASVQFFSLAVVFLAVPFAIYLKHIPGLVHFLGVLICGFVAGMNICMGIQSLKNKDS